MMERKSRNKQIGVARDQQNIMEISLIRNAIEFMGMEFQYFSGNYQALMIVTILS